MRRQITLGIVTIIGLAGTATADEQTLDQPVGELQPYTHDSGLRRNATGVAASADSHILRIEGAAWVRVHFDEVQLEKGSYVRIRSLLDNEVQELDGGTMAMWGNSSAYFNGDAVSIELVADARTSNNRYKISQVERAMLFPQPVGGNGQCGICGVTDDRVPSNELWTARLFPAGCTATVYTDTSCMVSAGHCIGGSMVVQFNVPDSNPNCSTNNPPVADQFPIIASTFVNGGVGNDWSVLIAGTNGLGERPFDRYGELRPIAAAPASVGQTADLTGYGVDLTCTLSQTQQFANGPITQVLSNHYRFQIDLRGGNSGSSLIRNDEIIGIATHCPCSNYATRIDLPAFVNARNVLCSNIDPPSNDDCVDAIPFNDGLGDGVIMYSTIGATTDGPPNPIVNNCNDGGARHTGLDIWYTYMATCTGDLTITTCDDLHGQGDPTYDTDLVLYGPYPTLEAIDCEDSALSDNRLACNDDDPAHSCGTSSPFSSTIEVEVVQGEIYLIRVGGATVNDAGVGWLSVDCSGPTVSGACCFEDGSCIDSAPFTCGVALGDYQGDGTDCSPNPCPQPCSLLGDIDQDGQVRADDIPGYILAKLSLPPGPGENQACADYGNLDLALDTADFVADLLNP